MKLDMDPQGGTLNFSRVLTSGLLNGREENLREEEWDQLIFSSSQIISYEVNSHQTITMILSNEISIIEGEDVNEDQGFNTVRLKITITDAK